MIYRKCSRCKTKTAFYGNLCNCCMFQDALRDLNKNGQNSEKSDEKGEKFEKNNKKRRKS